MAEKQQRTVHFSGDVQGVGFRYTTCRVAEGFDVTGTVKNLPDGRVRIVVEGTAKEIDAFLDKLESRMDRHVRDRNEQTAGATGKFDGFQVVY
ncbi:MAG: acylphosphatase [Phycisphaerae bacterium]